MKQVFLLFAFFGLVAFTANAQKCSSKVKSASVEKISCSKTAAATMAALDDSIEKRVNAKSGKVSYVKKSICPHSGNVTYTDVEYCTKSGKFINVSPSKAEKKACTKTKGAKATKAAYKSKTSCTPAEKAACLKKCTAAEKAACLKSKSAKSAASTNGAKVKFVKNDN